MAMASLSPFTTTRTRRQQNSFQFTTLAFDKTDRVVG
jgi:hypothetical protein